MKMQKNQEKFEELRKKFTFFSFESFSIYDEKYQYMLRFHFNLNDEHHFYPVHTIPKQNIKTISEAQWNNLAFHIGMVELVSYWKAAAPQKVSIKPYQLTDGQAEWWKKLYFHALGEFFYQNGIATSYTDFMHLESSAEDQLPEIAPDLDDHYVLVPVGGGKDSAVTLELLKEQGFYVIPFAINPRPAILETLDSAGIERNKLVRVERTIDPYLLELNEEGYLNGHTPFSSLVAFSTLLFSSLTGCKHIALSNESSANEATIPGTSVNHQYSKTYEFEKDFRDYYKAFISKAFNYFSFLRPLNELQIASLFSKYKNHFPTFKSCNVGSKDNIWCGECSKCLFTAIILAPFVGREQQQKIFGKDLLDDHTLKPLFDQLTGSAPEKPFECVGTVDEVNVAARKAASDWERPLPSLLASYQERVTKKSLNFDSFLKQFDSQHFLEKRFLRLLINESDE